MTDVCVVGSFMMDLVVRAPRRPAAGETIVGSSFDTFLGGKGFNQAVAAARSGASTLMVGRLGDDDYGRVFRAACAREGIDDRWVGADPTAGTGVAFPLVEDSGENSIVIIPRANHAITVADVEASAAAITASRVLLLQLELPEEVAAAAARIARAAGVTVVLNPAPATASLARFAGAVDYVVPNETEVALLTGAGHDPDDAARALAAQTGARGVVLTLAEKGALVLDGSSVETIGAHTVECVDTVGAGDAFCGAMAARLATGASLFDAARYGNAAGALAVTRRGAEPSMPLAGDIEALAGATPVR